MKQKILLTTIIIFSLLKLQAQELKTEVYKGTINGKVPITLYLQASPNPCTVATDYDGMYQYDGLSNWLQLNITKNEKNQFVLVEYGFTGVLILQKTAAGFNGSWISPDAKKQLKVVLKKTELSAENKKPYEDKFEEVNYTNYDC